MTDLAAPAPAPAVVDVLPAGLRAIAPHREQIALERQASAQWARARFHRRVISTWQLPWVPEDVKQQVRARDITCVYCGADGARDVDHVWPKQWGGPGVIANLQLLCADCNRWKWHSPVVLVRRDGRMYALKVKPRLGLFMFARWPRVDDAA